MMCWVRTVIMQQALIKKSACCMMCWVRTVISWGEGTLCWAEGEMERWAGGRWGEHQRRDSAGRGHHTALPLQGHQLQHGQQDVPLSLLESGIVQLLDQMVDIDVPGLQTQQQLLAFRPGDELHVEGVVGDEGEESWRDL